MTDEQFLGYCSIHCETPVAGFHKDHVARLLRLAGEPDEANEVAGNARQIYYLDQDAVLPRVEEAREIMARSGK